MHYFVIVKFVIQVGKGSSIYVHDILNTTTVVVLRGYDMKSIIFIIMAFENKFISLMNLCLK